jgi:hypothetical protein
MANTFFVNAYQINQSPVNVQGILSKRIGFANAGFGIIEDCSGSLTTRSLSTGFNVYSVIIASDGASSENAGGTMYYCTETVQQLATIIG